MSPQESTLQAVRRTHAGGPEASLDAVDVALAGAVCSLLALGVVMVASASISTAERELGEPLYFFWRQLGYVVFGLVCAAVTVFVPTSVWQRASPMLLVLGLLLLSLVLVPGVGHEVNGSVRWLRIGPLSVQPSEFMKLFAALYLAGYLVRRSEEIRHAAKGFYKPVVVLSLISLLLLLEPDYGACVVMFAVALGMLFLGGVPLGSFLSSVAIIVACMVAVTLAAPYRLERLTAFVDPWADPFGSGFQLTQALIAIGRGEWTGVGLGSSVQKLFYLPEAHTDFLFAVLAEELGMLGMITVIALFAFIVVRSFQIARRAQHAGRLFSAYLAYGLGLLVGLQAFINIGVNMGILPTKGLTLPLMSYGGSSVLVNCLAAGLLLRIDRELRCPTR